MEFVSPELKKNKEEKEMLLVQVISMLGSRRRPYL